MRFITRVLLLQLLVLAVVTAMFTTIQTLATINHLEAEARSTALAIARTIAADPDIRAEVDRASGGEKPLALQDKAGKVTERTGALFIVITDDRGVRLTHPNPDRLEEQVSTDHRAVLEGKEVTAWETGTLGESARAKVPVYSPGSSVPVGMVSVGFERASVYQNLRAQLLVTGLSAVAALLIGTAVALVFRKRWEKSTLGLQPGELVALVQNQEAVLNGVGEGVIAVDRHGVIRLANQVANDLLGAGELTGHHVGELALPEQTKKILRNGGRQDGVVVRGRVLYLDSRTVHRDGVELGEVIVVRDRTDMTALSERLGSVRTMTNALRVQRHEFANSLHVAAGLLEAGRVSETREFLATLQNRGPVDYPLENAELLGDPFLRSFLGLKSMEAVERRVSMRVGADSLLFGELDDPEEAATVLGNLVDNAVDAAVRGPAPAWVEVTAMQSDSDLIMTIADSGDGLTEGVDVFGLGHSREAGTDRDSVHGHGIGLSLSRELVERRGGRLWIIDRGGDGAGAVFGVQLPGVMTETGTVEQVEEEW